VTLVLAVEVGGVIVADLVPGLGGVIALADHQPPSLLKSNLLLVLKWTHVRDGFEVSMKAREAHPQSCSSESIRHPSPSPLGTTIRERTGGDSGGGLPQLAFSTMPFTVKKTTLLSPQAMV
jgi:hypothetical protein